MARYSLVVLKVPLNTNQPLTMSQLEGCYYLCKWCTDKIDL